MTFKKNFEKNIVPSLKTALRIKNNLAVPRINKINVNVAIGSYLSSGNSKDFAPVVNTISQITGQRPVVKRSRKAISNFKLRLGMPVGVTATMRGQRMYDFLNKLINVVIPRVRDFRGLSKKSFDGHGNYNIGLKEYTVFPEIRPDDVIKNHGVQVTIVTTAGTDEKGYVLLKGLGFPFK